jgi:type IV pilus assembly protein PilX
MFSNSIPTPIQTRRLLRQNFGSPTRQQGIALVITLVLLAGVALLALAANRSAILENKASTAGRDYQVALTAAESALADLKSWIATDTNGVIFSARITNAVNIQKGSCPNNDTITRGTTVTTDKADGIYDLAACTYSGGFWQEKNLAQLKALMVTVGDNPLSVGSFPVKSSSYPTGTAEAPKYMIDILPDTSPGEDASKPKYLYRVTALGVGPTSSTAVLLQETVRPQD